MSPGLRTQELLGHRRGHGPLDPMAHVLRGHAPLVRVRLRRRLLPRPLAFGAALLEVLRDVVAHLRRLHEGGLVLGLRVQQPQRHPFK